MPLENKFSSISFAFLALFFFLAGCQEQRVAGYLWPDLDDPYMQLTEDWTRKGALHTGLETDLIAYATLKSPQWMEAYARKRAEDFALTDNEKNKLIHDLREALQKETEIFLALFRGERVRTMRLRFDDPLWSVFLVQEENKIYPLEIRQSRQPLARLEAYYPYANRWQDHYELRFPQVREGPLTLVITGPLGRIELNW